MSSAITPDANSDRSPSTAVLAASSTPEPDYTIGGFELNDIFTGNTKLSDVQQLIAIEFLGKSKQIQLERIQCIADGALLAAEQVQDVRLDKLEKGPEVDSTAVIVDLFVALLLDSSIPGRVMKLFANSVCKPILARSAILKLSGKDLWKGEVGFSKLAMQHSYAEAFRKLLPDDDLRASIYLQHAKAMYVQLYKLPLDTDVQKDVTALGKLAHRGASKQIATEPLSVHGDTPGVSLTSAVLQFVSTNRLLIQFQYARMETFIRLGFMNGDQARELLRLGDFEQLETSLKEIRDRCKLLFEAIIWGGIFRFDDPEDRLFRVPRSERADDDSLSPPAWKLKGIDKRLSDYWMQRFGKDIQNWASNMDDTTRRELRVKPIDNWAKTGDQDRLLLIEQYFKKLLKDLPQSLQDAKALASSYVKSE